jgi:hypothetical protein
VCWQTYFMLCARWGSARDASRAFLYLLVIVGLQLTLLRLYGIVADMVADRGNARSVFGETNEEALYAKAFALAMNATGLSSQDLDWAQNATLLRANLLEYRSQLHDEASTRWLSGVPVKLATYTATGLIILLHVSGDMVNGVRLLIFSARLSLLSHLEANHCVSRLRLSLLLTGGRAEMEQSSSASRAGERPSWLLAVILVLTSWLQIFVSLMVAEYCTLAVETELNLRDIFLNFISLTFIVNLDDMLIQGFLFRPHRQYIDVRRQDGVAERQMLDLSSDLDIELSWHAQSFMPELAPTLARWLLGDRILRMCGYDLSPQDEATDVAQLNPRVQLPFTKSFRRQRLTLIALLSATNSMLLFCFSHFARLDKTVEGALEPRHLVSVVQLLSHTLFGVAMGVLYVEHIGVASGGGWLVSHMLLLAFTQQCVEWGLTMAEMLLPANSIFDTNALIRMLRALGPTVIQSFFATCLIAFCLGHRSAGELELRSGDGVWKADSSHLGSVITVCASGWIQTSAHVWTPLPLPLPLPPPPAEKSPMPRPPCPQPQPTGLSTHASHASPSLVGLLTSHFQFQILPTGPLTLIREAAQLVATASLSAQLRERGQYFFGSSGSVQGHTALTVLIVGSVTVFTAAAFLLSWWFGTKLRKCLRRPVQLLSDRGFSFFMSMTIGLAVLSITFMTSRLSTASQNLAPLATVQRPACP